MLIIEPKKLKADLTRKIFFWLFHKIFFGLKNIIKSSQHEKLEKIFFGVKLDFSFLRLNDQRLVQ